MIKKIYASIKRKIIRIYEKRKFYQEKKLELERKYNQNKHNIWFIGSAHYDNIGDLAISEATIEFVTKNIENANIIEIRLCDYYKYYKAIKKIIKPKDLIIMQGGGNMGFAYFDAEFNRREVIKHFPKNKIIIFPSTIDYGTSLREKIEFKNSIKIYNKHKNLTICAREEKSYELMKKIYKNVLLVPDIVLSLENKELERKNDRKEIIICLREDIEKTNQAVGLKKEFLKFKNVIYTDNIAKEKNIGINLRKKIFNEKLNELSKGKVVITDRLHVMIFCTIIEIPCLFIDNSNKKLSGTYNKWIKNSCNYVKELDLTKNIDEQINKLTSTKHTNKNNLQKEFINLISELKME